MMVDSFYGEVQAVRERYGAEMTRYLTPDAKAHELAEWERYKIEYPRPADDNGGHGYPDPEMNEWCDRLNAIQGVCTTQSCAGHMLQDARDGTEYIQPGQLWLWLDKPMSMALERCVFDLVECSGIERVTKIYHANGREIIDIVFHGAERGMLDRSMTTIVDFFFAIR